MHILLHGMNLGVAICTAILLCVAGIAVATRKRDLSKSLVRQYAGRVAVVAIVLAGAGCAVYSSQASKPTGVDAVIAGGGLTPGSGLSLAQGASASDPLAGFHPIQLDNSGSGGHVVFTFDDGPDVFTPSIVDELAKLNIKAIFFTIGRKVAANPTYIKTEVDNGDEVGNHTWDHHSFTGKGTGTKALTQAQVRSELSQTQTAVRAAGAPTPTLWRPPYGAVSVADARTAASMGLRLVMDSSFNNSITDSDDWSGLKPSAIARLVEQHINTYDQDQTGDKGTEIIAFHDGISTAANTLAALPLIVEWMNWHHIETTLNLPSNTTGGWLTQKGQEAQKTAHGTGSG